MTIVRTITEVPFFKLPVRLDKQIKYDAGIRLYPHARARKIVQGV